MITIKNSKNIHINIQNNDIKIDIENAQDVSIKKQNNRSYMVRKNITIDKPLPYPRKDYFIKQDKDLKIKLDNEIDDFMKLYDKNSIESEESEEFHQVLKNADKYKSSLTKLEGARVLVKPIMRASKQDLEEIFGEYGSIRSINFACNNTVAWITFDKFSDGDKAVKELNGRELDGKVLELKCEKYINKY